MFRSSVIWVVTHGFFFLIILILTWVLLLTGHLCYFVFIFLTRWTNHSAKERNGRWRRWSCWHLAKMSVSLRSLSRVWTSWLACRMRKTQLSKRYVAQTAARPTTNMKRQTLNAPHTHTCGERVHMWTGWRHVSTFLLSPLQYARPQFSLPPPTSPQIQVQYYTNLSRTYLLSLPSPPQLTSKLATDVPPVLLRQRKASCLLFHLAITKEGYLASTLRRVSISVSLSHLGVISSSPDPFPCPFSSHMFPPRVRVNQDISSCEKV